ncbi:type II toxin-antitoxin system HicB family antitoxin [Pseudolactococcus yaeyamensis]
MLKTYPAIFHKEDNGFWVEFPEFNGATEGNTLDAAITNAQEFLAGILAYYIDENKDLPTPSDITQLATTDGFTSLIQVDPTPFIRGNKTVRKNVTVPEWLVKKAQKEHINFSETLTEALLQKIV